jgi:hypothetical protein
MAKKLVHNYTFDASAQTIKIRGRYLTRALILITNVTDNIIIYNFADATAGATSVTYDSDADETTITLSYNTTSMSDSDELQILLDEQETTIEPGESIVDPVHKMRVSNPENLIDTDFEYGLQPTKWETIELVSNIPSVYTRDSGVSIGGILSVESLNNSRTVTVTTSIDHDLSLGDPIEVQGLKSRTAQGKYIVTAVVSTTVFTYEANENQSSTGDISSAYTTIIPGSFFSGSTLGYQIDDGIATDNASPSTLTFTADHRTSISSGTSLYITNTVGKQEFDIANTSATAPDGASYVSTGTTARGSSFYLPGNNLYTGQQIFIAPGSGGSLPSTLSGAPEPSGNTTVTKAYNSVKTACDSIISNMSRHEKILMYHTTNSYAYYCDGSNRFYSNGNTGSTRQTLLYGDYNVQVDYARIMTTGGSTLGTFYAQNNGRLGASMYTGLPFDEGSNFGLISGSLTSGASSLGGYITRICTPFTHNSFTDYLISVTEIKDFSALDSNAARIQYYKAPFNKRPNFSTYRSYDLYYEDQSPNNAGSGWYYVWAATHHRGGWNSQYQGHIGLTVRLWNTGWNLNPGTSGNNIGSYFDTSYISLSHRNFSAHGSFYDVETVFSYNPTSLSQDSYYGNTGTEITLAQMASTIASQISGDIQFASFSGGTNTVKAINLGSNRIQITDTSDKQFRFSNNGTGPLEIETGQVSGALDNYYDVSSISHSGGNSTFTISAESQIAPRTLEFTNSNIILYNSEYYIKYDITSDGHGIVDGTKLTFNNVSGTNPGGISNGTVYYAIVDDNLHFRLATNESNWLSRTNAITGTGSGSFNVKIFSISGRSAAAGTINSTSDSKVIDGTGTKFLSTYKIGDTFSMVSNGETVNNYTENEVASIVSDTKLALLTNSGITTTSGNHYVDTKINVRADGEFLHRPFDGGVDITAGKSPDSQIVRQTRKYFRYQSGKGIQCSMAINFNPARPARLLTGSGTNATLTTEYPHGLSNGNSVKISGSTDSAYNGTFTVANATETTFGYTTSSTITDQTSSGYPEYAIQGYSNAGIRAGLFDFQNGFFFEYDGSNLYAVRRSSVQQIAGTARVTKNTNRVFGTNSVWTKQLSAGDMIVIRGQSYKVSYVSSNTEIHIEPAYRGTSNNGVIVTKTVDTKVAQSNWNIDAADGTGPSGFNLDINKIQMVYLDYSWYGAGKIRFGFKDGHGRVRYMHEFIHNNKLNEAYMRSGNIPARYEAFNTSTPTYVPSLFHWGTSVIMDGGFDDDDSYLFTASGNTLTFTNGDSDTAVTTADSELYSERVGFFGRLRNYYVKLPFATADASKFTTGIPLYTSGGELNGDLVDFTSYGAATFDVYVFVSQGYSAPASYPDVSSGTTVNIGAPSAGSGDVDLNATLPLISIRLAPSVDNNLIGELGARDIINRMQLKLQELGVSTSHDAEISVILNGSLSNLDYENVGTPSLSQYIAHDQGDTVNGGTTIYSFRASGGATDITGKRLVSSNAFDLSQLIDLGNSILGGDGVFPNGPDIITITANVINTAEIDSANSFQISSRLSWAESQA